jgi:hypothetical protein
VSRAIQVRVSESVVRTIHVEDGVAAPLEVLPILPPERMAELVAGELAGLGFARDGDVCTRTEPDGTVIAVDLARSIASVTLGAGVEVSETAERAAVVGDERAAAAAGALRADARQELEQRVAERAEALRREVTAQLEGRLADVRRELDAAIGRATVAALGEKAAQLGRVEDTQIDAAGNVTIRVRV